MNEFFENIIVAEKGKVLFYKPEQKVWGKSARLADYKGHILEESDFEEVDISNADGFAVIDGLEFDFRNKSYAYIKTTIIKIRYSNDDQIALMLNHEKSPQDYAEAYAAMQQWRDYAAEVANQLTMSENESTE